MLKPITITQGAIIITKHVTITKELLYQFSIVLLTYIFVMRLCISCKALSLLRIYLIAINLT